MSIEAALKDFADKLIDALGQNARGVAEAKASARDAGSQFTIAQIAAGSLGTQIDDAEKRVMRRIDGLNRKLDALLRASNLNPEDFADG